MVSRILRAFFLLSICDKFGQLGRGLLTERPVFFFSIKYPNLRNSPYRLCFKHTSKNREHLSYSARLKTTGLQNLTNIFHSPKQLCAENITERKCFGLKQRCHSVPNANLKTSIKGVSDKFRMSKLSHKKDLIIKMLIIQKMSVYKR